MPISLLHKIAQQPLPIAVSGGSNIDAVRILSLAGHIKADVPKPIRTLGGYAQPDATVVAVTALGRSMLRRFPQPREAV